MKTQEIFEQLNDTRSEYYTLADEFVKAVMRREVNLDDFTAGRVDEALNQIQRAATTVLDILMDEGVEFYGEGE